MSHFLVLVIGDNVHEALQPFHEYECTGIDDEYVKFVEAKENIKEEFKKYQKKCKESNKDCLYDNIDDFTKEWLGYYKNDEGKWGRKTNPNAKWDWWQLGGRWSGDYFIIKHGAVGGVIGTSGAFGNTTGIDSIKLKYIDWEAMRKRGENKAKEYWEKIEAAFDGVIPQPKITWDELIDDKNEKWKDININEKRELYFGQPELKLLDEIKNKEEHKDTFGFFFNLEDFACGKEQYIHNAGENAMSTFAIVHNGKWYEKGKMGWWGITTNETDDEKWNVEFSTIIAQCDEDELVSFVDCHI